ncbi:PepSY domain-containing protein [Baekduia sp. Peel2402]|uniref:PepSY domain-containing protein n=1 Tax=Baekduia sp. Peel2402 TaxID=3458296 RepID=UPI00403ED6D4
MTNIKTKTTAVAAAVGLSLGGAAIATAASSSSSAPPAGGHPNETALTGTTADQVKAAALAKVPGATVLRVETDAGGVYEAHLKKSDGTEVEVHVDKDYNVTSVDTRPAGGRGGHGGRGGRGHVDTAALAKALGVTEAKLTAALDATRPAAKDKDKGGDDGRAAAIAKALGQSESDVQAVLDANRPDRGAGGTRGGGDRDALAKALAAKFGISQSKAQSALDGIRDDRETAFATALAKELGLDAAKVKSALDAQHPNHP